MHARLALPLLLVAALTACGDGDGDPAEPQPTVTVTVTETVTPTESEPEPTETASPTEPAGPTGDPCADIAPIGSQIAFIVVSAPTPGAPLASGDTVEGCGNTFEAGYQWQLLDAQQAELDSGFGTMTCGNGCQGDFSFTVDYTVGQPEIGTLRVFESSAQDGSEIHVNAIPVLLQP